MEQQFSSDETAKNELVLNHYAILITVLSFQLIVVFSSGNYDIWDVIVGGLGLFFWNRYKELSQDLDRYADLLLRAISFSGLLTVAAGAIGTGSDVICFATKCDQLTVQSWLNLIAHFSGILLFGWLAIGWFKGREVVEP